MFRPGKNREYYNSQWEPQSRIDVKDNEKKLQPHLESEVKDCMKHFRIINKKSSHWKSPFRNTHMNLYSLHRYPPTLMLKIQTLIIIIAETAVYQNKGTI